MASVEEHVRALLKLPAEDRARAARQLLDSLDDDVEGPRPEQAWAVEIERRLSRIDAGEAKLVSMDEAVMGLQRAARGR
jgi:putative addiction module component (TIGR02574 family)